MIYPAGRYNLNFDVCAIVISAFLLLYLVIGENLHVRRIRSYFFVMLDMLLCSSGELAMDIVRNENGISFTNAQAEAATFISHVAHNSLPFLLVMYFLALTGLWHELRRRDLILVALPEAILILMHVVPPLRHLLYFYQGNCEYVRGPLYPLYYAIVALYAIYGVAFLIARHSSIERSCIVCMAILCVGCLGGMAINLANTYIRITNFVQTLVLASTFLLLQDESSFLDKVTGVYNAAALDRDTYPLFHSPRETYILSIKLQSVNDYRLMVGMGAMGQVLHQIGAWMLGIAGEDRCFYRVGSGEFAVLLFGADEAGAKDVAERVRERFTKPWAYAEGDAELTIPAQVWVSSIPDRISNEEQVIAFSESAFDADLPQDQVFVADEMRDEERRAKVNVAIRRAIATDGFNVFYQPIYDTATGTIRSCEALVRMTDPELGPVSPEEFIKVAERGGTISQIGSTVFEKVCEFIAERDPARYGMGFIEVNLSPIQCMDQDLVGEFEQIMARYGVRADQIVLEITESAVIRNEGRVNSVIEGLKDAGFHFALDDFGTGQANYSYLREFPFSIIKIDKSFLWAADKDLADRAVLRSMLGLVKDLGLKAVVEGVETQPQRDGLVKDGVSYLQGYYYSKPIPADRFMAYLRTFNAQGA